MSRLLPARHTRRFVGLLSWSTFLGLAAFAAGADPIVGRWSWHNHVVLFIHADGTAGLGESGGKGKWECVRPNEDPRKYILDWNRGQYYETLYLKKHGRKISGYDQFGHHVWGVRIED
ncbi:hypothetical protein CfE428DRAFT_6261 [Chthoniobacter flavus Ellin428]|uniref:Uncharacterized protein n=1 Tax=Chthoniobacter flavus Ellin428 TaxID=497964 RepID=B4DBH0_9BACT|nr:hypothetical protein [Chthoniobacter flavus]EDY16260.1 hypothetical protein CfE428DRAFT_6261 [Chthoniobacter flavus Ellin428]TCO84354.1 hypothetical protein EV701_1363 [Chthoniobacter flavus]